MADAEDHYRHLTGQAAFLDDTRLPGDLVLAVLRSPIAHGLIRRVGVDAARDMPGVRLIQTAGTLAAGGLTCRATVPGMRAPPRPVLAGDRVVHVGQAVASVVAQTEAQALDALEQIELDIEPLPDGSPVWPEIPDNRAFAWSIGNTSEDQFDKAALVVEVDMDHPRIAISPVETRGCIGAWEDGAYTLWTPSQGVVSIRTAMANCLGVAPATIRVITGDVGGSFAVKIWPYPEQALVLDAARQTGARVAWTGTRTDAFIADIAGRGRFDRGRLALDADGRFLAFDIQARADLGAFVGTVAASTVTTGAVRPFQQLYDIPAQGYRVEALFSTTVPTDAYRGAGKPESAATLERLIDLAAQRLGMDRLALRRRNLITPGQLPYTTAMGETIDSGDFPGLARRIETRADWAGLAVRKAESAARGLCRGAGVGFHVHATGGSTAERVEVRALPDGMVRVLTGAQDSGQGHRAALARVAAGALDLPPAQIRVEQGDSAALTQGGGTGGSNLLPVSGPTVHRAARAMLDRARDIAGDLLEAATVDLSYEAGTFRIAGTDRRVDLSTIAAASHEIGCVGALDFAGTHTTWPNGVYVCEVEVDPDTGAVCIDRFTGISDIGRIIDLPGALGQLHGGIGQSVGEALCEGMAFDTEGQPLTGSLMDYALPRAVDMPFLDLDWAPTDSPNTLLGAKGVGELPSIGAPAVIVNAVLDALAPFGVTHVDKPLTPGRIWQAIQGAKR